MEAKKTAIQCPSFRVIGAEVPGTSLKPQTRVGRSSSMAQTPSPQTCEPGLRESGDAAVGGQEDGAPFEECATGGYQQPAEYIRYFDTFGASAKFTSGSQRQRVHQCDDHIQVGRREEGREICLARQSRALPPQRPAHITRQHSCVGAPNCVVV